MSLISARINSEGSFINFNNSTSGYAHGIRSGCTTTALPIYHVQVYGGHGIAQPRQFSLTITKTRRIPASGASSLQGELHENDHTLRGPRAFIHCVRHQSQCTPEREQYDCGESSRRQKGNNHRQSAEERNLDFDNHHKHAGGFIHDDDRDEEVKPLRARSFAPAPKPTNPIELTPCVEKNPARASSYSPEAFPLQRTRA